MATKKTTAQKKNNDLLKQNEIREVVEETVETLLKDHPEAEKAIADESEHEAQVMTAKPELSEVSSSLETPKNEEEVIESTSVVPLTTQSITLDESTKSKKPIRKIAVIVIIVIVLLGLLLYFLIPSGGIILNQGVAPTSEPSVTNSTIVTPTIEATPTLAPTLTPVSTTSALTKSEVKIQVLNGSGVSGLAGVLKDRLTSLGFTNIETGNAEGSNSTTTIAVFSEKVPQAFKDTIMEELNKTFTQIDTQVIPPSDKFDVFITTGQGLK